MTDEEEEEEEDDEDLVNFSFFLKKIPDLISGVDLKPSEPLIWKVTELTNESDGKD